MRDEYQIENLNPRRNPYVSKKRRQITIEIDGETMEYFEKQSKEQGLPYQTLINLYLADCAANQRILHRSQK